MTPLGEAFLRALRRNSAGLMCLAYVRPPR
jgi:hypothetical protein